MIIGVWIDAPKMRKWNGRVCVRWTVCTS
jgi:hypothetical protein